MGNLCKSVVVAVVLVLCSFAASAQERDSVKTLEWVKDTCVINTTTVGRAVEGFNGRLPLLISVLEDVIVKIEALPNDETPRFMAVASALLTKWNGLKVKEALEIEVDAVSGATYSSKAIIENVRLGLEYYEKNKE